MGHVITGTVVSDLSDKTIIISVVTKKTHPLYKKQYTVRDRFMAHDENNTAKAGDLVSIVETRPQSARKRFKLLKVVERGGVKFQEADATADIAEIASRKDEEKK